MGDSSTNMGIYRDFPERTRHKTLHPMIEKHALFVFCAINRMQVPLSNEAAALGRYPISISLRCQKMLEVKSYVIPQRWNESPWSKIPWFVTQLCRSCLGEVASGSSGGADRDEMRKFPNGHVAGKWDWSTTRHATVMPWMLTKCDGDAWGDWMLKNRHLTWKKTWTRKMD